MSDRETHPGPRQAGSIGIRDASDALGVHPRTLMAYERIGLVKPARRSNRRVYSSDEVRWLGCVQAFNRDGGISLRGLSTLLRFVPCWAIRAELGKRTAACCPPEYPVSECLERTHRAYSGAAPEYCEGCGVYRSQRAGSRSALESEARFLASNSVDG
jgi:MerR family transcriptional regulator/heat shock protein HspR